MPLLRPTARASRRRIPPALSGLPALPVGWIGSTTAFGAVVQEAVDQVRAGDRLQLCAAAALELGPQAAEGEQRSIIVERKPDDILLAGLRVRLRAHIQRSL